MGSIRLAASAILSVAAIAGELVVDGARVGGGVATIEGSLIQAYRNNPQLNAQRAATRAVDENVPTALSGYRPRLNGTASLSEVYLDNTSKVDDGRRASRSIAVTKARLPRRATV